MFHFQSRALIEQNKTVYSCLAAGWVTRDLKIINLKVHN